MPDLSRMSTHLASRPPTVDAPSPEPLTVPADCLIGLGREFALLYSQYFECPPSFFYFAFLTYFGALSARWVTLASAIQPEPRLYTILVGDSADTRKSTALRVTDQFFRALGEEWTVPVLFGVGSAEGLAAELQTSSSLLLHYDEFKYFVDKARAEHSVAMPMVSTLFERGEYDNRVKEGKISVRGACLSLLAACTQETYQTLFTHQFHAIGFLNRLWLVVDHAPPRFSVPPALPMSEVTALQGRVRVRCAMLQQAWIHRRGPIAYQLTPDAYACFDKWYHAREGTVFEKRLDTYGHRLMVLLAATSNPGVDPALIGVDVVDVVVQLLQYQLAARRETDPIDAESTVARTEERIRRCLVSGPVIERTLKRTVHVPRIGLWAWTTAVENLKQAGELEVTRTQTLAGQHSRLYRLRPEDDFDGGEGGTTGGTT